MSFHYYSNQKMNVKIIAVCNLILETLFMDSFPLKSYFMRPFLS